MGRPVDSMREEGGKNRGTEPEGADLEGRGRPPELGRDFRYPREVEGPALAVDALRPPSQRRPGLCARPPEREALSAKRPSRAPQGPPRIPAGDHLQVRRGGLGLSTLRAPGLLDGATPSCPGPHTPVPTGWPYCLSAPPPLATPTAGLRQVTLSPRGTPRRVPRELWETEGLGPRAGQPSASLRSGDSLAAPTRGPASGSATGHSALSVQQAGGTEPTSSSSWDLLADPSIPQGCYSFRVWSARQGGLGDIVPHPGPWTVDPGPWTVDPGPWTVDPGPWTVDPGPWTLDPGLWTLDPGPRAVDAGRVCGKHGSDGTSRAQCPEPVSEKGPQGPPEGRSSEGAPAGTPATEPPPPAHGRRLPPRPAVSPAPRSCEKHTINVKSRFQYRRH
ncbi:basic salivary proline-rich protein 1-like [Ovis aries]|uniref:basic salivary proline-rich protein 1-like n=1 Tax=Ovis aries TaxID=9940 RepID=UPI001C2E191C|nr:basic salivary proline-rich protein 1-like [Ovis aries]